MPTRTCSVDDCTEPHNSKGYCTMHGSRVRRWGDPHIVHTPLSPLENFWSKVDKSGECWQWTGGLSRRGYPYLSTRATLTPGGSRFAHRASYELNIGPIPDRMRLDQSCRNRLCVKPDHLEVLTLSDLRRRRQANQPQ